MRVRTSHGQGGGERGENSELTNSKTSRSTKEKGTKDIFEMLESTYSLGIDFIELSPRLKWLKFSLDDLVQTRKLMHLR